MMVMVVVVAVVVVVMGGGGDDDADAYASIQPHTEVLEFVILILPL